MSLPVIEQDGTSYVPVFTSEATMKLAAPDIGGAVSVPVAALGANWPSDELWLAVNPGTEGGLTLPPDAVKSLPSYDQLRRIQLRSRPAKRCRSTRQCDGCGPHGETGVPVGGTRVSGCLPMSTTRCITP